MARKKTEDAPPPGSPAWMATFADMMNLLLCFFVLLFAMSSIDAAKFEIFAASFNQAFSVFTSGGSATEEGGVMIGNGASQLHNLADLYNSTGMNPDGSMIPDGIQSGDVSEELLEAEQKIADAGLEASEMMAAMIGEAIAERGLNGVVDIEFNAQYVLLRMNGQVLFDSGSAVLHEDALRMLAQVAPVVQRFAAGTVQIEGHTDNVPMGGGSRYANNDELSSGRAYSVFRFLMENTNLNPRTVVHAGRGEYDPIADNSTAAGRQMNRRVEIKLFNNISSY